MASIQLSVLSYNTHLFGDLAVFDALNLEYADDERKHRLMDVLQDRQPDIVLLQEVWSGAYAKNFRRDLKDIYPNFFARHPSGGSVNWSGCVFMAKAGIEIQFESHFNFIEHCNIDGFDIQDDPPIVKIKKGYIWTICKVTSEFDPSISDDGIQLGILSSHMITNQSSHPKSANCCFQNIADQVKNIQSNYPSAGLILGADLNVTEYVNDEHTHLYDAHIRDILEKDTEGNLLEAYEERRKINGSGPQNDPGFTINGETNTLWQWFNKGKKPDMKRPDYVFSRNSADQSVILDPKATATVLANRPDFKVKGGEFDGLDISDHYPIQVTYTLSSPQIRS